MSVSRETDARRGSLAESPALRLRTVCAQNGLNITDSQGEQMERFVALLLEWNQKLNLVSRKTVGDVWRDHILHSVSVLFFLELRTAGSVMDIGTGGGLPGIPLKILRPDLNVTLVDSIQKKILAVQGMLKDLELVGVKAIRARVEDIPKTEQLKQSFDYTIARGVAPLKDLVKWSMPVLKSRSTDRPLRNAREMPTPPALIALKGGNVDEELKKAKELKGIRSIDVINLTLKGSEQLADLEKKAVVVQF